MSAGRGASCASVVCAEEEEGEAGEIDGSEEVSGATSAEEVRTFTNMLSTREPVSTSSPSPSDSGSLSLLLSSASLLLSAAEEEVGMRIGL